MGEYWRVSPRFWYQRHLSDDAKLLALYLLTCEHRELEGLFRLPKAYICADLKWSAERLAEPFQELLQDGFIDYDDDACVLLIHKALKYQRPDNPNQEKHALEKLEELPPTRLFAGLLESAEQFAERFAQRLKQRFGEPFAKPTPPTPPPTPAPTHPPTPAPTHPPTPAPTHPPRQRACDSDDADFEAFFAAYPKRRRVEPKTARRAWAARRKSKVPAADMIAAARNYAAYHDDAGTEARYIKHPSTFIGPDEPFREWVAGIPEAYRTNGKRDLQPDDFFAMAQMAEAEDVPDSDCEVIS